eukprot:gene21199-15689_t
MGGLTFLPFVRESKLDTGVPKAPAAPKEKKPAAAAAAPVEAGATTPVPPAGDAAGK